MQWEVKIIKLHTMWDEMGLCSHCFFLSSPKWPLNNFGSSLMLENYDFSSEQGQSALYLSRNIFLFWSLLRDWITKCIKTQAHTFFPFLVRCMDYTTRDSTLKSTSPGVGGIQSPASWQEAATNLAGCLPQTLTFFS